MDIKRVAPPPTDEELYAVEQTQRAKDQAQIEANRDAQEQTRLAQAGDPDAKAALAAGASLLTSRPAGGEDERRGNRETRVGRPRKSVPRQRQADQSFADGESDSKGHDETLAEPERQRRAFKLMDAAFRKWKAAAAKDLRKANRELARDLGGDMAIYLQAGILRLNDGLDSMIKLAALGKAKEESEDGAEDFETEMESVRSLLRGGK